MSEKVRYRIVEGTILLTLIILRYGVKCKGSLLGQWARYSVLREELSVSGITLKEF